MPLVSALPEEARKELEAMGQGGILVGIPSFNNAATIGHVAGASARGMVEHFPGLKPVLVNSDGGSTDDTPRAFMEAEAPAAVKKLSFRYHGIPGKGSSLKALFEACDLLGVKVGVVVDSDLRSITPLWIKLLAEPVVKEEAGFVAPYYARHKYDGTITNNIVYPMTRALYGVRIRQPIGGDFAFSTQLARVYTEKDVWETDVARFGIDVFMTTTAVTEGFTVCQANLGAKIHSSRDPTASLGPMFRQVTGTIFHLMRLYRSRWETVTGSVPVPILGPRLETDLEPVNVDLPNLLQRFRSGCQETAPFWKEFLAPENFQGLAQAAEHLSRTLALARPSPSDLAEGGATPHVLHKKRFELPPRLWARTVYDFALEYNRGLRETDRIVDAMTPIYFGRVASYVVQTARMSTPQAEKIIEQQAEVFEQEKPYLLRGWQAMTQDV